MAINALNLDKGLTLVTTALERSSTQEEQRPLKWRPQNLFSLSKHHNY